MGKLQLRKGLKAVLPTLDASEPGFATDTKRLYIGNTDSVNVEFTPAAETTDYTIYVASSTYGGDTEANGKTGRSLAGGTADATEASKLHDADGGFTSAMVGEAVYNSTDDTWTKVSAFVDSGELTLAADIFVSGEVYAIVSAVDNTIDAFNLADSGYRANITILLSPESFSDTLEFVGKTPGGAKTLTIQGSTSGTSTIAGEVTHRQKIIMKNITMTKRHFYEFGADIDCTTVVWSGDDGFIIRNSDSTNAIYRTTSVAVYESDPGQYTNISSTVTIGYSVFVAKPTQGGNDSTNDGFLITQGSATSTSANKLVDTTANFNSADHLNKTVFNTTDKTWAEITAIDSTTQVTLDTDIMASGEAYKIVSAMATVQGGVDRIPGTVNSETTVKISNGTFTENVLIQGKTPAGAFDIIIEGTLTVLESLTAGTGSVKGNAATRATVERSSGTWTLNQRQDKLLRFTSGTLDGVTRIIDSNDASTTATMVSTWHDDGAGAAPANGDTFVVEDWATIIDGSTTGNGLTLAAGQKSVILKDLRPINGGTLFPVYSATHMKPQSSMIAYRCNFDNPNSGVYGVYAAYETVVELWECYIGPQVNGTGGVWFSQWCVGTLKRCKVYKSGRTGQGVRADGGRTDVFWGTVIDHGSGTGVGLWPRRQGISVAYSGTGADEGNVFIQNCDTGIMADRGGIGELTAFITFSGNTTADKNPTGASDTPYID